MERTVKIAPVPIDHLEENPYQMRQIDVGNLSGLVESISRYGFIGHLEARHNPYNPTGKLQLIFGHRRVRASELAGLKSVPVKIVDRSDDEMRVIAYLENGTVEPLTYWEEALHFQSLQQLGMTMTEIGETIGKSKGYVQSRLDVLRLPEGPIKDAARTGRAEMTALVMLLTLKVSEDRKEQILRDLLAGRITATDIRNLRAAVNNSILDDEVDEHGRVVHRVAKPRLTVIDDIPEPLVIPEAVTVVRAESPAPETAIAEESRELAFRLNHSSFAKKDPRDYAVEVNAHLQRFLPSFRETVARADLELLNAVELTELEASVNEIVRLTKVPVHA